MNEYEMKKMIEKMAREHPEMPRAMRLTVRYDETLQKITCCAEEPVFMGEGGVFVYLLQNVFMAHPELEKQYPPGTIALAINGSQPKPHSQLIDWDFISFSANPQSFGGESGTLASNGGADTGSSREGT